MSGGSANVRFRCNYGSFQNRYLWFLPVLFLGALVGIPLGFFANTGWKLGNQPIEPWSATLIIEVIAVGALLTFLYLAAATIHRRRSPGQIVLTETELFVPKGTFSSAEVAFPLAELEAKVHNAGFVKQLQLKHGRRRMLLSSALFPTNAHFDQLAVLLVG